ncbi:MAG TPA: hypothetical protein VGR01_00550 [Burkholderiales bacterium]|nr:hypothetical protein [Burkholderiales bacterium]
MFDSAELGHSISKRTYAGEVPKLREALSDEERQQTAFKRSVLKTLRERLEAALER